jgi:hypothetical protein
MCIRKTICDECGKNTDGLMTCTFPDGAEIQLCSDCFQKDGSFCKSCGCFCSGIESFDFIHPGYCDNCIDEMEQDDFWGDEDNEWDDDDTEEFPNGSLDY